MSTEAFIGIRHANSAFLEAKRLLDSRDVKTALEQFDLAERLGHSAAECAGARWTCWMLMGRFEQAWQESDRIAGSGVRDPHRFWDGRSWHGQRVMLRCLHGLGDTIQFIRYAPLLRQTCRSLFVQTHPELVTLLQGVRGIDHVFTWGPESKKQEVPWDMQMEVTELPRAFRTVLAAIPAATPYIRVPQENFEWAAAVLPTHPMFKVGVVWKAGPFDPARSMALEDLRSLFTGVDCEFHLLQRDADIEGYETLAYNTGAHTVDVRDTAALILQLDLVITVDTMTAHLAGALGKPVWVLLPVKADWRWMLDRRDTPWYPSARLFRQVHPGQWRETIQEVTQELAKERIRRTPIVEKQFPSMALKHSQDNP